MDLVIAPTTLPLRWEGVNYEVVKAGISSGVPYAEVTPNNESLVEAIIKNLQDNMALKVLLRSDCIELIN